MKRDFKVKMKAVSNDQCRINFKRGQGWTVSEQGLLRPSQNGTYIFFKNHSQMQQNEPSDPVLLKDGMLLCFGPHELRVKLGD